MTYNKPFGKRFGEMPLAPVVSVALDAMVAQCTRCGATVKLAQPHDELFLSTTSWAPNAKGFMEETPKSPHAYCRLCSDCAEALVEWINGSGKTA